MPVLRVRICRRASCFANSQLIGAKSGLLAVPAQRDPAANEPFFKAAAVDFRLFFLQSPFYSPIIPQLHAQLPLWHLKRGPVSPLEIRFGPTLVSGVSVHCRSPRKATNDFRFQGVIRNERAFVPCVSLCMLVPCESVYRK